MAGSAVRTGLASSSATTETSWSFNWPRRRAMSVTLCRLARVASVLLTWNAIRAPPTMARATRCRGAVVAFTALPLGVSSSCDSPWLVVGVGERLLLDASSSCHQAFGCFGAHMLFSRAHTTRPLSSRSMRWRTFNMAVPSRAMTNRHSSCRIGSRRRRSFRLKGCASPSSRPSRRRPTTPPVSV